MRILSNACRSKQKPEEVVPLQPAPEKDTSDEQISSSQEDMFTDDKNETKGKTKF